MDHSCAIGVAWSVPADSLSVAEANRAICPLGLFAQPLETSDPQYTTAKLAVLHSANYGDLDHLLHTQAQLAKPSLIVVRSPEEETRVLRRYNLLLPMEICRADVMSEQLADRLQRLLRSIRPELAANTETALAPGSRKIVYDHEYLNVRLAREFANARKHCRSLTVVWMVVNHLESIGRNYGENARARLLEAFSTTALANIRLVDWMARHGHEEFCLVLPDTWLDEARVVVDRIRNSLAGLKIAVNDQTAITPEIAIGVAEFSDDEETYEDLIQKAAESVLLEKLLAGPEAC